MHCILTAFFIYVPLGDAEVPPLSEAARRAASRPSGWSGWRSAKRAYASAVPVRSMPANSDRTATSTSPGGSMMPPVPGGAFVPDGRTGTCVSAARRASACAQPAAMLPQAAASGTPQVNTEFLSATAPFLSRSRQRLDQRSEFSADEGACGLWLDARRLLAGKRCCSMNGYGGQGSRIPVHRRG